MGGGGSKGGTRRAPLTSTQSEAKMNQQHNAKIDRDLGTTVRRVSAGMAKVNAAGDSVPKLVSALKALVKQGEALEKRHLAEAGMDLGKAVRRVSRIADVWTATKGDNPGFAVRARGLATELQAEIGKIVERRRPLGTGAFVPGRRF